MSDIKLIISFHICIIYKINYCIYYIPYDIKLKQKMKNIEVKELKKILDSKEKDYIVVDVRTPWEYASSRLKEGVNIPLKNILAHKEELKNYKNVYLICRSGNRSSVAGYRLESNGLTNTVNIIGGMASWKRSKFETIESKAVVPIMLQVQLVYLGVFVLAYFIANKLNINFSYLAFSVFVFLLVAESIFAKFLMAMPWNKTI